MRTTTYREAGVSDLGSILSVQYEAFGRVAEDLGIAVTDLPPLSESRDTLARMLGDGTRFFVAVEDGRVIGAVRGTLDGDCVHVGRLVVATSHVRRGIGTQLMQLLETSFCECARFRLFTGADAGAALALYRCLGYTETEIEPSGPVQLVWLEKRL